MRWRWGRVLMGNNTGGRAVMLWPVRFLYVGVWILAGLPSMYLYSCQYAHWILPCAKYELHQTFRISWGVCVMLISFFKLYFKQFVISSNIFHYHLELQKFWEYLLWNSEVCCYVHKGQKMDPILSHSGHSPPSHPPQRYYRPIIPPGIVSTLAMSELIMENSVDYKNIWHVLLVYW
jgi:hypothetical protein